MTVERTPIGRVRFTAAGGGQITLIERERAAIDAQLREIDKHPERLLPWDEVKRKPGIAPTVLKTVKGGRLVDVEPMAPLSEATRRALECRGPFMQLRKGTEIRRTQASAGASAGQRPAIANNALDATTIRRRSIGADPRLRRGPGNGSHRRGRRRRYDLGLRAPKPGLLRRRRHVHRGLGERSATSHLV